MRVRREDSIYFDDVSESDLNPQPVVSERSVFIYIHSLFSRRKTLFCSLPPRHCEPHTHKSCSFIIASSALGSATDPGHALLLDNPPPRSSPFRAPSLHLFATARDHAIMRSSNTQKHRVPPPRGHQQDVAPLHSHSHTSSISPLPLVPFSSRRPLSLSLHLSPSPVPPSTPPPPPPLPASSSSTTTSTTSSLTATKPPAARTRRKPAAARISSSYPPATRGRHKGIRASH